MMEFTACFSVVEKAVEAQNQAIRNGNQEKLELLRRRTASEEKLREDNSPPNKSGLEGVGNDKWPDMDKLMEGMQRGVRLRDEKIARLENLLKWEREENAAKNRRLEETLEKGQQVSLNVLKDLMEVKGILEKVKPLEDILRQMVAEK